MFVEVLIIASLVIAVNFVMSCAMYFVVYLIAKHKIKQIAEQTDDSYDEAKQWVVDTVLEVHNQMKLSELEQMAEEAKD